MSALAAATARTLDPAVARVAACSCDAEGPVREAAIGRLHALLLREAAPRGRRRTAALAHPPDATSTTSPSQAADDALVVILAKARPVPRRGTVHHLGAAVRRARGAAARSAAGSVTPARRPRTPTAGRLSPTPATTSRNGSRCASSARSVGRLIAIDLTPHQREVLIALTIEETSAKSLAPRLDSTPGARLQDAPRRPPQAATLAGEVRRDRLRDRAAETRLASSFDR